MIKIGTHRKKEVTGLWVPKSHLGTERTFLTQKSDFDQKRSRFNHSLIIAGVAIFQPNWYQGQSGRFEAGHLTLQLCIESHGQTPAVQHLVAKCLLEATPARHCHGSTAVLHLSVLTCAGTVSVLTHYCPVLTPTLPPILCHSSPAGLSRL